MGSSGGVSGGGNGGGNGGTNKILLMTRTEDTGSAGEIM